MSPSPLLPLTEAFIIMSFKKVPNIAVNKAREALESLPENPSASQKTLQRNAQAAEMRKFEERFKRAFTANTDAFTANTNPTRQAPGIQHAKPNFLLSEDPKIQKKINTLPPSVAYLLGLASQKAIPNPNILDDLVNEAGTALKRPDASLEDIIKAGMGILGFIITSNEQLSETVASIFKRKGIIPSPSLEKDIREFRA